VHDRAGRDAGEDAFLSQQRVHGTHRLLVRDQHLPVELRDVEDRGDVAVAERAETHHGVARQRLRCGDDDVGERLTQARARTHERAAGAETGDEHVDPVEREGDLRSRSLVVRAWVRLVRVLERHEVARLPFGELEREPHGAVRPLGRG